MEFNDKLYQLRKLKGISQEELAGIIHVSRQTVSKWELGESTPDMEKLVALRDYFEISLDELVLDEENDRKEESGIKGGEPFLEKVMTPENKRRAKKGAKIAGIIAAVILGIDILSMIIYFIVFGAPK